MAGPTSDTFTCGLCHQTFLKGRSDAESLAETAELFGPEVAKLPTDMQGEVCDPCFVEFKAWWDALTPERRAQLEAEDQAELRAREGIGR